MFSKTNKVISFRGILLSLICAIAAGCSGHSDQTTPQSALQALENNQPETAQEICDELTEPDNFDKLDAGSLCELSTVFMALPDAERRESKIAMAAKCLEKAYSLDSVSVYLYIDEQPIENRADLQTVISLLGALDSTKRPELLLEIDADTVEFAGDSQD